MTYNEVLQRIINGYHKVGFTCVAVLRQGVNTEFLDDYTIFEVVLRKHQLNNLNPPSLYRHPATLSQHEELIRQLRQGGNITDSFRVHIYTGRG